MRAWPSVLVLALVIGPWSSAQANPAWSDTADLDNAFAELTALATPLEARRPIDCVSYRSVVAPLVRTIEGRIAHIASARARILEAVFDDWLALHRPHLERIVIAVEHLRRDKACLAIRDDDAAHQTARLILAFTKYPPIEWKPSLHCNGMHVLDLVSLSLRPSSILDALQSEVYQEMGRRRDLTACLEPITRSWMGEL